MSGMDCYKLMQVVVGVRVGVSFNPTSYSVFKIVHMSGHEVIIDPLFAYL